MNSSLNLNGVETADQNAIDAKPETTAGYMPKAFNIRDQVDVFINHFCKFLDGSVATIASTGSPYLDQIIGLRPGEMSVIAARPGMGKTALMLSIAEHACIDQKVPTLIYSGPSTTSLLVQRIVFSRAKYAAYHLFYHDYVPSKSELHRIQRASNEIASSMMFIEESSTFSVEALRDTAIRHKRDQNIGLIAIDHIHMIAANSTEGEVAEISSGIKDLAVELGVPILVIAPLKSRPECSCCHLLEKPQLFDLDELCSIDQHADMVGLLHRPDYYSQNAEDKEARAGEARLILTKNRNGDTGQIPLTFIGKLMRFEPDSNWLQYSSKYP